jgi:two-component system NarL family response regulator
MNVLLVDNRVLFLEGLQSLLQSNGIEVAGTALSGTEALEKTRLLSPDVVLMDVTGTGQERLAAIRRIRAENPTVKIIVFADSDENLMAAVQSGACGYLLTNIQGGELLQKLGELERGEVPFSPGLTVKVLEGIARLAAEKGQYIPVAEPERTVGVEQIQASPAKEETTPLTVRQKEILDLVAKGLTYRDVGESLGIKECTVKYHMEKIMKRLRLKKREQVVACALEGGCEPESG